MREKIAELLDRISSIAHYLPENLPLPMPERCLVLPRLSWDRSEFEDELNVLLPEDLVQIWNLTSGLVLFEDVNYGQWGLVIWSPDQTIIRHRRFVKQRRHVYEPGDVLVGEFLGDSDLVLVRCDPEKPDYGAVLIALATERRQDWFLAARSFFEFLTKFVEASGEKYWEAE